MPSSVNKRQRRTTEEDNPPISKTTTLDNAHSVALLSEPAETEQEVQKHKHIEDKDALTPENPVLDVVDNEKGEEEEQDEGEEEGDWRDTVFYWRGVLSLARAKNVDTASSLKGLVDSGAMSWCGAWVGSESGLPSDSELKSSKNTFELTCKKLKESADGSYVQGNLKGYYELDQGDGCGLQRYSDLSHRFRIVNGSLVVAKGTTEFGAFISAGTIKEIRVSEGCCQLQLTLARRYIDDNDPRKKRTIGAHAKSILDSDKAAFPWRLL